MSEEKKVDETQGIIDPGKETHGNNESGDGNGRGSELLDAVSDTALEAAGLFVKKYVSSLAEELAEKTGEFIVEAIKGPEVRKMHMYITSNFLS